MMMKHLRNNFTKSTFGFLLLSMLMLKFFSYSISTFTSSNSSYSTEKGAEDNKDKDEESFEKAKKKLQLYESSATQKENLHYINRMLLPAQMQKTKLHIFPPRTVPTPPPDFLI